MTFPARSRRDFLTGRPPDGALRILPPGASESSIRSCTGCGACAEACPTQVIAIRSGVAVVDFGQGECIFCGRCAERCPEPVFAAGAAGRFAHHAVVGEGCLAFNRVDCQACRDSCAAGAIRFRPQPRGPFVPELDADACTGCGACIGLCPTAAITMTARRGEAAHA